MVIPEAVSLVDLGTVFTSRSFDPSLAETPARSALEAEADSRSPCKHAAAAHEQHEAVPQALWLEELRARGQVALLRGDL